MSRRADMPVNSEAVSQIVDLLLNYVHEGSYAEAELESVMVTLSCMDASELHVVETVFIDRHAHHTRLRCINQLEQMPTQPHPMDVLSKVLQLWKEVAMPSQLVPILTPGGIESTRRVFAALVRDAVDWVPISRALAQKPLHEHVQILRALSEAGLDDEANAVLAQRVPLEITGFIQTQFSRQYGAHVYEKIEQWLQKELIASVEGVLEPQLGPKSVVPVNTLQTLAWESLARLRIGELYRIIATANTAGIEDLRRTVTTPELRNEVVSVFSEQCRQRVLNGGADTVEIIEMYLQTIKGFSVLDPQGVLLERVSKPIQQALKERADTSAVIAEGLFGISTSSLAFLSQELEGQPQFHATPKGCSGFGDWKPDPVDAPADFVKKQVADSVATLINLYDNKEVFVKQFSTLYSHELLNASFDSSSDVTLARLEQHYRHLAQRFGESHLHKIGVMLGDMRYSHETAALIHEQHPELKRVSGVVLSRLYWPAVNAESGPPLQLPASVRQQIQQYAELYQNIEGHESLALEWLPSRGRVSLEIELSDRTLDLVVEPEQAILITAFGDSGATSLALTDLLRLTQLDEPALLSAIQFWVSQGVIGTNGEEYKILETRDEVEAQAKSHTQIVTSTELGSATTSKKPVKDPFEDMQVYWSYIKGMLTNLGALPLEKIHSFLVLFVPNEDPYVKTKQELESYLLAMVDEEQLQLEDGKFRLPRK